MTAGALYFLLQSFTGCGCLYTCGYRGRLRAKYGLAPAPCGDFCVDCWCLPCSLAQQYREMTSRGIQPDLGTTTTLSLPLLSVIVALPTRKNQSLQNHRLETKCLSIKTHLLLVCTTFVLMYVGCWVYFFFPGWAANRTAYENTAPPQQKMGGY